MMQNHFELFHLSPQFALDMPALDAAYRELQGRVHPDRFVNAGEADKRAAMQWATQANEAYRTLKMPLKRAAYLCELNGNNLQAENNTAMPVTFLMQQMEWREALQEALAAKDVGMVESLEKELRSETKKQMQQIEVQLSAQDFNLAAQGIRQAMFLEKFGEELAVAFEILET